ncbi:MAG: 1-deoxy-D-xylulose-5-phosphate reductoisomerase, partial [Lachnospiraceae bacterium]|nr:1-deoxy-D-xylulose-5-phosphate reductoisomerase [Lachnospiraceae bacterium]
PTPVLDLTEKGPVAFLRPDTETFRGLPLANRAEERGGTMPTVYNAADEEAVAQFLDGKIRFLDIYDRIEGAMEAHRAKPDPDLTEILEAEKEARESVRSFLR